MRVMEVLADATNVIAEGEVLQLMNMHDPDLAVDDYLRVIRFKTAKLFEASARLGAVLAGADADVEEACADYGRSLGTAFQLIDDVLDYEGDTARAGQERRRRSARGQADAAAADRDGARHRRRARADPPRHRARRGRSGLPRSSTSCAAPARWTRRATPRAAEADKARSCLRRAAAVGGPRGSARIMCSIGASARPELR